MPRRRGEEIGVLGEGLQDVSALSARCGDDGAQGGEGVSAMMGAEGTGDFHLHRHHPERLFGQVVGEGNLEVGRGT